jgi:Inverse autotransporter, beta-domain
MAGVQAIRRSQLTAGGMAILGTALALLLAAPAAAQTTPPSEPLKWGPFLDLEGKAGTRRNIGTGDLFVPMLQDSSSMLFADIRGRFDDHSDQEGNFDLGVRHMLENGWNLGTYGFYDAARPSSGPRSSRRRSASRRCRSTGTCAPTSTSRSARA